MKLYIPLVMLAFAAASGATVAHGQERVLGYAHAQSTSTCIGDPKTPLCAIETLAACMSWSRQEYCDRVGKWRLPNRLVPSSYMTLTRRTYMVFGPAVLSSEDIPQWTRAQGVRSWQPGDLLVQLWWGACYPDDQCVMDTINDPKRPYGEGCPATRCERRSAHPQTYVTRMVGETWHVIDWRGERLPEVQNLLGKRK